MKNIYDSFESLSGASMMVLIHRNYAMFSILLPAIVRSRGSWLGLGS